MGIAVENAPHALPSLRPSTSGSFMTLISLLERWLRPDMLTAAEAALVDELKRACRVLGAPLLEAESRDDLNDRIERIILLPEFQRFNDSTGRLVVVIDPATLAKSSDELPVGLVSTLGDGPASVVAQGARLIPAMLSVVAQLAVIVGPSPPSDRRPTIAEFFAQSGLHSTILAGLYAGTCSSVAMLGIAHAVFEGAKLSPWLALALAETFRDGAYAHLCVMASLPVNVPEAIVPLADRYDLDALQRAVAQAEAALDATGDIDSCEVP